MVDIIRDTNGTVLAMIIRSNYKERGIKFFTPADFSQQLAFIHHSAGHVILPHIHNKVKREILYTQEVLVIKRGKMRCDFYSEQQVYFTSEIVETGDVILLANGGHGFECIEETEMYEIKQGPYLGELDKIRFEPYKFN